MEHSVTIEAPYKVRRDGLSDVFKSHSDFSGWCPNNSNSPLHFNKDIVHKVNTFHRPMKRLFTLKDAIEPFSISVASDYIHP